MPLKDLDQKICSHLQLNGRLSLNEIATAVDSSVPTVSEHVKRLEADGVITGYHAHLDAASLGLDVSAYVFVDIDSSMNYDGFRKHCRMRPEIQEVHAITGSASHLIKVRIANTQALEQLLSMIQRWKGVTHTHTNVILSTHKETTILPL
jgi:Lrp/AsnC family transcriptional regulator, leucine-responsive regulatory protein